MNDEKLIDIPKADDNVIVEKNVKKEKEKTNNNRLFLLMGILLLFIAIIFCSLFLFILSPKKVLKSYVGGMRNFNSEQVVSTFHKDFAEAFKREQGKDFKDILETSFKAYKTDGYEIESYEINYNYTEFTKSQETAYKKMLKEEYRYDTSKIKKLRYYPVRYKTKYSTGMVDIFTQRIVLAKIGYKWYVFPVGEEVSE